VGGWAETPETPETLFETPETLFETLFETTRLTCLVFLCKYKTSWCWADYVVLTTRPRDVGLTCPVLSLLSLVPLL
jgi:hypothetical protein